MGTGVLGDNDIDAAEVVQMSIVTPRRDDATVTATPEDLERLIRDVAMSPSLVPSDREAVLNALSDLVGRLRAERWAERDSAPPSTS